MGNTSSNDAVGKSINSYSAQLLNNKSLKVGQTITAGDGGHISIFVDANGNVVGSINRDADGKIRNVAFEGADGSQASYNDRDENGTIDSVITKRDVDLPNEQKISKFAKNLESNKDLKVLREITADDGGHIYIYADSHGNVVGSVNKDPDGNVRNVFFQGANGNALGFSD